MWTLLRVGSVLVLGVVTVLLAGRGDWLIELAVPLARATDTDPAAWGHGEPSVSVVMGGLVAGAALALGPGGRRVVGQVTTLLHELGHTLAASAFGARPAGIVLRHDASGHATARWLGRPGPLRRLSLAVTAFVGLPSPAVAAAAGAELLATVGSRPVLWSLAAAGVTVALLARSLWSLLVAAGLAALAVAALTDTAEPWAAGVSVALLTATAVAVTVDALRRARRPIPPGDDARAVHRQIGLPPRLVQLMQVAATVGAGAWTVWLLLELTELPIGA